MDFVELVYIPIERSVDSMYWLVPNWIQQMGAIEAEFTNQPRYSTSGFTGIGAPRCKKFFAVKSGCCMVTSVTPARPPVHQEHSGKPSQDASLEIGTFG